VVGERYASAAEGGEPMTGNIFLLGDGDELLRLGEAHYEAESVLQKLLAEYPDLLAGEQVSPSDPRRWLLVSRELAVAAEEGGGARWALDHLFIDQDGIPTLVEVKRSTNSQIRREVVGQMLDYAANGSAYWSLEQVIGAFERRCEREGVDPAAQIAAFLGDEGDAEGFWQIVKTNLQAGRVRLVFVADEIPAELRRIIEFLNQQMDPAEVLGLEVHQYIGQGSTVLVPRVVGLTAEAERAKAVRQTRTWDRPSFLAELESKRNRAEAEAAARILDWCENRGLMLKWGTGAERGSCNPKLVQGDTVYNLMNIWSWAGEIQIPFGAMKQPPFNSLDLRRQFADRLEAVPGARTIPDDMLDRWPMLRLGRIVEAGGVDRFLEAWDWYLEQIPK
jgi:hypothetical protein